MRRYMRFLNKVECQERAEQKLALIIHLLACRVCTGGSALQAGPSLRASEEDRHAKFQGLGRMEGVFQKAQQLQRP